MSPLVLRAGRALDLACHAVRRAEKRLARRLIAWLIRRYRYHGVVLDTAVPNVRFLRVKSLVVVNGYGQEHVIRSDPRAPVRDRLQGGAR